jgi:hypothetical protein
MKIYQTDCASCHGDIQHPHATFGDAFYPRAPQFAEDAPDIPENRNFYIIQHGIRLSGMPAWKRSLSEQQNWQVTIFLSVMNKLLPTGLCCMESERQSALMLLEDRLELESNYIRIL